MLRKNNDLRLHFYFSNTFGLAVFKKILVSDSRYRQKKSIQFINVLPNVGVQSTRVLDIKIIKVVSPITSFKHPFFHRKSSIYCVSTFNYFTIFMTELKFHCLIHQDTSLGIRQDTFNTIDQNSRPSIERPGLESRHSRKRLFFHRNIFNSLDF